MWSDQHKHNAHNTNGGVKAQCLELLKWFEMSNFCSSIMTVFNIMIKDLVDIKFSMLASPVSQITIEMVASPPNAWWWSPARGWTDYHAPLRSSGCTPDGGLGLSQDCGGGLVGTQRFHSWTSEGRPSTMSSGCKPTFKLSIENFQLSSFECWKLKP